MSHPVAAAVALFALGALFAGTLLLLLLNPGSRGVRWWALFQAAQMVWLGAQGWAFATGGWDRLGRVVDASVHLLPALFLAFTLVEGLRRSDREAWLAVALGVLTLPAGMGMAGLAGPWFLTAWHVSLWSVASYILLRFLGTARAEPGTSRRLAMAVTLLLLIVGPLSLAGYLALGGRMWIYVMPLLVVWVQFLVFIGVARLRFYDIEVRLRRTGEVAAETAEQARLAVVGELAASLAHEIRNPLTGVRSLAQRLSEEEIDEARRRRYGAVILEEVGRVERLVANLLGVARRTPRASNGGAHTPLRGLVEDLSLLLSARAERAGVELAAAVDPLELAAPREPLVQVLLNLLLNAIAHAPPGSRVALEARADAGEAVLAVRDQGPGVRPEERERIWDAFYSGSGGTGLGLAVVRRLAQEHGWRVGVDEAPGGGAEFWIRVPLRSRAPAPGLAEASAR